MSNYLKIFLISMMLLFTNDLTAKSFSVMTFNVENMFDNLDDPKKKR